MMKFLMVFALVSLGAGAAVQKTSTVTKVVKLLKEMLDKSVTEGDAERKIYAKFKCYCDTSEAEKNKSIKEMTEQIALLESDIEETQGSTGELSSECADLKAKIADNAAAQDEAQTIRDKENRAFNAEEADLQQGIKQMESAIDVLTEVGADQTKSTGADNKQFMAGHSASLLSLQKQVQTALSAASALMSPTQRSSAAVFLQAPFTGTYTSQSGAVMGIIKSMRDTFIQNLGDARVSEKNSLEAFTKLMKILEAAHKEMSASYQSKQKALGGNDGNLADKKSQLSDAQKQKKSDEDFLESLLPMCEKKAEGFATRKLLRTNEEAAIAEAISILNSDDAFATFQGTSATSTGFIQLRSVRRHEAGEGDARRMAQKVLQVAAKDTKSARLSKVLAKLQAENPFDTVLDEIDKMIDLIGEEAKQDQENLDFCNKERKDNNADLKQRKRQILSLNQKIDRLTRSIKDPKTGLKVQIEETEQDLVDNTESQKTQTTNRVEENLAYQKDVKNLVAAQSILTKAIKVLKAYYDDLEQKLAAGAFMQEDPAPPAADFNDAGQSSKGGDVMDMLEFIHEETVKEEMEAHKDEEKGQHDYEDSMTKLKKEQKDAEENLAGLQDVLAQTENDLLVATEDLKDTTADKEAIEAYLLKIKPGCDFITENFDQREKSRATEGAALKKAIGLIKATPAYKTAISAATVESYGDCKKPCVADAEDVQCKACQADVTIPAYCAGHKGTKGC